MGSRDFKKVRADKDIRVDLQKVKMVLASLDGSIMKTGKHEGQTFEEIYESDPGYVTHLTGILALDAAGDGRGKAYKVGEHIKAFAAYAVLRQALSKGP